MILGGISQYFGAEGMYVLVECYPGSLQEPYQALTACCSQNFIVGSHVIIFGLGKSARANTGFNS